MACINGRFLAVGDTLNDAKVIEIYEGTKAVEQMIIGRTFLGVKG